ncbi:hypothetical protein BJ742DRAFT_153559 [Cladochytrium replicatum]|nr:hypothetical protein BJ742DRAFT_153559 [Cladochytrium replicatum]
MSNGFRAWIMFMENRRHKISKEDLAFQKYRVELGGRAIRTWREQFASVLEEKSRYAEAAALHTRITLKNYLNLWKEQSQFVRGLHDLEDAAIELHIKGLKRRVVTRFRHLVQLRWLAIGHDMTRKLTRSWACWEFKHLQVQARIEEVSRSEGIRYHSKNLLQRTFRTWRILFLDAHYNKSQLLLATQFRRRTLLKRSIAGLSKNLDFSHLKQHDSKIAMAFQSVLWIRRFWSLWCLRMAERLEFEAKMKQAAEFHQYLLVRRGLVGLYEHAKSRSTLRDHLVIAEIYRNRKLARNVLLGWWNVTESSNIKLMHSRLASRHREVGMLRMVWSRWSKRFCQIQEDRMKLRLAVGHFQRLLLSKAISAWGVYAQGKNSVRINIKFFLAAQSERTLKHVFADWRKRSSYLKDCRIYELNKQAEVDRELCRTVFLAWRLYADHKAHIKHEEREAYHRVLEVSKFVKKQYAFKGLKGFVQIRHYKRSLKLAADHFIQSKLQERAFKLWTVVQKHAAWEKMVNTKAIHFHDVLCLKHRFALWRNKRYDWKALYHFRYIEPALQRERHLLKQTFHVWKAQAACDRDERRLVEDAVEWRQTQLIKTGVTAWLKFADEQQRLRKDETILRQATLTIENFHRVEKFARRWWMKTLANRERRSATRSIIGKPFENSRIRTSDASLQIRHFADRSFVSQSSYATEEGNRGGLKVQQMDFNFSETLPFEQPIGRSTLEGFCIPTFTAKAVRKAEPKLPPFVFDPHTGHFVPVQQFTQPTGNETLPRGENPESARRYEERKKGTAYHGNWEQGRSNATVVQILPGSTTPRAGYSKPNAESKDQREFENDKSTKSAASMAPVSADRPNPPGLATHLDESVPGNHNRIDALHTFEVRGNPVSENRQSIRLDKLKQSQLRRMPSGSLESFPDLLPAVEEETLSSNHRISQSSSRNDGNHMVSCSIQTDDIVGSLSTLRQEPMYVAAEQKVRPDQLLSEIRSIEAKLRLYNMMRECYEADQEMLKVADDQEQEVVRSRIRDYEAKEAERRADIASLQKQIRTLLIPATVL